MISFTRGPVSDSFPPSGVGSRPVRAELWPARAPARPYFRFEGRSFAAERRSRPSSRPPAPAAFGRDGFARVAGRSDRTKDYDLFGEGASRSTCRERTLSHDEHRRLSQRSDDERVVAARLRLTRPNTPVSLAEFRPNAGAVPDRSTPPLGSRALADSIRPMRPNKSYTTIQNRARPQLIGR